jgi:hypothetical protein
MGKIAFIDDMPDADKNYILSHREEILDLATELGIVNVRVGYTGRLVGTITDGAALLANYAFTAKAGSRFEHIIYMFPDEVAANPGAGDDLKTAVPL